jgi:2-polyprenyl-6-methoxyphenol hydroxylase-like FAD-dependent oxidoreductase
MNRVVIVGGGIGGLCAARAVELAGGEPVVLERDTAGGAVGAGLLLWPNAIHALDALGYGAPIRAAAAPVTRTSLLSARGRMLSAIDIAALTRRAGAPMLVIERPALHEVLADGIEVRGGHPVAAVDTQGAVLESGERIGGDAVIGADGIGSVARAYVDAQARPLDSGYAVVRGISDHDIGRAGAYEAWGAGRLVGAAALPHRRTYWFYEAPALEVDPSDPLACVDAAGWPEPTAAVLAATPRERVLVNHILRLGVLPKWTRGSVALLGDAAHAMEPNLGQGAAQTIEDAAALLVALRAGLAPADALARYASSRMRRARMIQRESSRFARFALSAHARPRDLLMRATPSTVRARAIERLMSRYGSAAAEAERQSEASIA